MQVDYTKLAAAAVIVKEDNSDHDDLYMFTFVPVGVSVMGEHAKSQEEAIKKVAIRLERGDKTGNYMATEDIEQLEKDRLEREAKPD